MYYLGKTHTMSGSKNEPGLIPLTLRTIFEQLNTRYNTNLQSQSTTTLTLSYLELYNEKVYDLIQMKETDLPVREDSNGKICVHGLSETNITSYESFLSFYELGSKNRKTASTKLNMK